MAGLSSIVALLAVALLIADAYAYRATITTVEVDEDNQEGQQGSCGHIRGRSQLRSCERYLRQQGSRREVLEINQWGREEAGLEECCGELGNVEEQCRCDALGEIAREVQSQQQPGGLEGTQILQKARALTSMCRIPPLRCQF